LRTAVGTGHRGLDECSDLELGEVDGVDALANLDEGVDRFHAHGGGEIDMRSDRGTPSADCLPNPERGAPDDIGHLHRRPRLGEGRDGASEITGSVVNPVGSEGLVEVCVRFRRSWEKDVTGTVGTVSTIRGDVGATLDDQPGAAIDAECQRSAGSIGPADEGDVVYTHVTPPPTMWTDSIVPTRMMA